MLEYTTSAIEKSVNDVKDKFVNTPEFLNIMVSNCLAKYERSNDYLKKYHDLLYTYSYCGTCFLVAKEDTEKFKGYYLLAAEAGDICYRLCDMGLRTNRAYVENLKPLSGSNFCNACIRPILPLAINSANGTP